MKKIFFALLLGLCLFGNSQDLPTIPASGFAFPLGTKFTIKLIAIDSVNFQ